MTSRFGHEVERHHEEPVVLRQGDELLEGVRFYEYPVDVPALIEVPSVQLVLYADVWERRGWTIHNATPAPDEPPTPVEANGHVWPCTRFYATATPSDACTCGHVLPIGAAVRWADVEDGPVVARGEVVGRDADVETRVQVRWSDGSVGWATSRQLRRLDTPSA